MKHTAQRLLLAVMLAVVVVMPGLLYPASARAADTLDQSQPVSQSPSNVGYSDYQKAQIFTAGMYGSLDRVSLRLENWPYNPTGAVLNVSIQTVVDGLPSGTQIGSGTIPLSALPAHGSGGDWIDVTISGAVVHAGIQYALVLQTSIWNAKVDWWYAYQNQYGSSYTGGEMAHNYGDGWIADGTYDFTFKTYVSPGPDQSQAVATSPATVSFGTQQAQIFTAGRYGTLDWVSLYLENPSDIISAGYLTISVQAVIDGLPSGKEIGRGTIPITAVPPPGSAGWVDVSLTTGAVVHAGTQYALVLQTTTLRDVVNWWYAANTGYAGGEMASNNGGGWRTEETSDFAFRTYVTPDVLDQSQTVPGYYPLYWSETDTYAQTFTARVSGVLDRVRVLNRGGYPLEANIQTVNNYYGHPPSGTVVAEGTVRKDIPALDGWVTIDINNPFITAGHHYAIVIQNCWECYWSGTQGNYTGGDMWFQRQWTSYGKTYVDWVYASYNEDAEAAFETYVASPVVSASPPPPAMITPCSSGICPAATGSVTPKDSTARVTSDVHFRELPDGTVKGVLNFNDSKTGNFVLLGCTTESAACRLTVTTFACTDQHAITVAGTYTPKGGTAAGYLLTLSGVKDGIGTFTLTAGDYTYTVAREGIVDVTCQ